MAGSRPEERRGGGNVSPQCQREQAPVDVSMSDFQLLEDARINFYCFMPS